MTPTGHRRLILTRHAKSDWDDPLLADHDRPLNARGRRSARLLGDWLASRGYEPEEVLCSTAARCRQTWDEAVAAPQRKPSGKSLRLFTAGVRTFHDEGTSFWERSHKRNREVP